MRARLCLGLLLLAASWAFSAPVQQPPPGPKTLEELRGRLSEQVSGSRFKSGTFGIKIVTAVSGKVVFENDANKLLSPASNSKLYTIAMALDRLGPDYRIRTSLYSKARPQSGVLDGDLVLFGRGDPCINARLNGGSLAAALQPLVAALTKAGVHEIRGDLVADDSFFTGSEFGAGWAVDDLQYYYGAEISSLTINDNTFVVSVKPGAAEGEPCRVTVSPESPLLVISNRTRTVASEAKQGIQFIRPIEGCLVYVVGQLPLKGSTTEEIPVRRPAALFAQLYRAALEAAGVKIDGVTRVVGWLDPDCNRSRLSQLVELGSVTSLPAKDIAREILKPSQNLYTDLLLAHLGESDRSRQSPEEISSEDLGLRELRKFLKQAGVAEGDVQFDEGSGLSRNNLATPNATVSLLQFMSRSPANEAYWSALPVAGVDGTMRNRMKGTAAERNVRAKTGTLRWAVSLSGDVRTKAGERLIFSLMLNRYHNADPEHSSRAELDAIAMLLANFTGKIEP